MKSLVTRIQQFDYLKALHIVFFTTMLLSCALSSPTVRAASASPADYRLAVAGEKFSGAVQFSAVFNLRPPRRFRAIRTELVVGAISTSDENRLFVSFGPVWRQPIGLRSTYIEFGISPTFIDGSTFNRRDTGGNFHFTSFAAIRTNIGRRDAFSSSLRLQHTSNGGLSNTNPGMDMIGVSFAFNR